jgi:hypothetical protein
MRVIFCSFLLRPWRLLRQEGVHRLRVRYMTFGRETLPPQYQCSRQLIAEARMTVQTVRVSTLSRLKNYTSSIDAIDRER